MSDCPYCWLWERAGVPFLLLALALVLVEGTVAEWLSLWGET